MKKNILTFIAVAAVTVANLVYAYGLSSVYGVRTNALGFADNLALVFAGSAPFEPRPGLMFVPPLGWLFLILLILYTTLDYPTESLHGLGLQALVRCRARTLWWASRFILVAAVTAFSLLVVVCSVVIWSLVVSSSFSAVIHGESLQLANLAPWFLKADEADALPFFTGLFLAFEALAFAQAVIGFVLGPSVSFVVLTSYLICSAFARHWVLLGNALMLLRWGGIVKEGIATGSSVLFSIAIMSLCLSLGGLWFRRADLIEKGDKI
ncbi:hypothetical protein [Collinsella aerofaciens]|uniref:hypothetical protein n=1 Tax=Collinsella aerofaciens TaxID=74426 RepID=UPI0034A118AA